MIEQWNTIEGQISFKVECDLIKIFSNIIIGLIVCDVAFGAKKINKKKINYNH